MGVSSAGLRTRVRGWHFNKFLFALSDREERTARVASHMLGEPRTVCNHLLFHAFTLRDCAPCSFTVLGNASLFLAIGRANKVQRESLAGETM